MSDLQDGFQNLSDNKLAKRQNREAHVDKRGARVYVGKTVKVAPNLAKIELKYYDDIHALQAINCSISALNTIIETCSD